MTNGQNGQSGQSPSARLEEIMRRRRSQEAANEQARSLGETEAASASGQPGLTRAYLRHLDQTQDTGQPASPPPDLKPTASQVARERLKRLGAVDHGADPVSNQPQPPPVAEAPQATQLAKPSPARPTIQEPDGEAAMPLARWQSVPQTPKPQAKPGKRRKRRPIAFLVGLLGELLITLGLLLGLFVVWELFWTTWETNIQVRAQLSEIRSQPGWEVPQPAETGDGFAPQNLGDPGPQCRIGSPGDEAFMGIMHVPRWGGDYQYPVHQGIDRVRVLNQGWIGWYPDTQLPGEKGNFATSAHRTTYGAPYNRVQELVEGDLAVYESEGCYLVYKMYATDVVLPTQYSVVWPVPNEEDAEPTKRLLTFTTCHPPFSAAERFIVWFEMEYWTDKTEGPLRAFSEPLEGG